MKSALKALPAQTSPVVPDAPVSGRAATVYELRPLEDLRWSTLVERHPRSSVFHTAEWLEAVRRTYGYEPVALTTSPPGGKLRNALVFCRVNSRLTGRRLVSLPFSDHCEPLLDHAEDLSKLFSFLPGMLHRERLKYVECRPLEAIANPPHLFHSQRVYCFHQLDLTPDLDTLFKNFHKDSTRRKIQRAEREGLTDAEGNSKPFLDTFCRLYLLTRQRHGIPPQPKRWFENLIACFGDSVQIRIACNGRQALAAILTIRHKNTLVYKYGCSDQEFSNLGGTQLLFWRAIQEAKRDGLSVFDLGRSDADNTGLVTFKNRWGAQESRLCYSRFTASAESRENYGEGGLDWQSDVAKGVLKHVPKSLWYAIGNQLYRHVG